MTVWDALIGQDDAVPVLRASALASAELATGGTARPGDVAHAWLFVGPAGSGRSTAARAYAAALQCERIDDPGCGQCTACHTVLAGTHPDVRVVSPEGLSITVKTTREVVQSAARLPATGRWQVVIITAADRLGEKAEGALLKAIEEPSPRTVFLLCSPSTHPDDVAVTVRSRCRVVALRTPSAAAVAAVLRGEGVDAETAEWAAAAGQGHVGRSRRLARDETARARRADVLAIPAGLTSLAACLRAAETLLAAAEAERAALAEARDAGETEALQTAMGGGGTGKGTAAAERAANAALKDLAKRQKDRGTRTQRDTLDLALIDLAGFYRDVVLVHAGAAAAPRAHPDFDVQVRAVAAKLTPPAAVARLDAVLACREALEQNVKPLVALEAMTATLRLPA